MVGLIALVILSLYIGIALFCIYKVKGRNLKLFVSLLFFVIPTADVIVGRIYFSYLCETQSGQFIYKAVELDDDYFLKAGEIDESRHGRYLNKYATAEGGEVKVRKVREEFEMPFSAVTTRKSDIFHIRKLAYFIKRKSTGELLSESIAFNYKGGWVVNIYNMGSGRRCPDWGNGSLDSLMKATFRNKE